MGDVRLVILEGDCSATATQALSEVAVYMLVMSDGAMKEYLQVPAAREFSIGLEDAKRRHGVFPEEEVRLASRNGEQELGG